MRLAALAVLIATPAVAQEPQCGPHANVAAVLADTYGESRIGFGMEARGGLVEFYADPLDGSWTILVVGPEGQACIASEGQAWTVEAPAKKGVAL